jgi:hypothetical protein
MTRSFLSQNLRFARLVQQSVVTSFSAAGWQIPDRGIIPDSAAGTPALTPQGAAYGHLMLLGPADPGWFDHPSTMPGALCEPLFLSDPNEAAIAVTTAGQHVLAQAFSRAVQNYFRSGH